VTSKNSKSSQNPVRQLHDPASRRRATALVFDAFTKCEHLTRWMGPRNLTMASCSTDLRVGAAIASVFRSPDGSEVASAVNTRRSFRRNGSSGRSCSSRFRKPRRSRRSSSRRVAGRRSSGQRPCTSRSRTATAREQRHGSGHDRRLCEARRAARRIDDRTAEESGAGLRPLTAPRQLLQQPLRQCSPLRRELTSGARCRDGTAERRR